MDHDPARPPLASPVGGAGRDPPPALPIVICPPSRHSPSPREPDYSVILAG